MSVFWLSSVGLGWKGNLIAWRIPICRWRRIWPRLSSLTGLHMGLVLIRSGGVSTRDWTSSLLATIPFRLSIRLSPTTLNYPLLDRELSLSERMKNWFVKEWSIWCKASHTAEERSIVSKLIPSSVTLMILYIDIGGGSCAPPPSQGPVLYLYLSDHVSTDRWHDWWISHVKFIRILGVRSLARVFPKLKQKVVAKQPLFYKLFLQLSEGGSIW